ncbi:hypothetical protein BDK51DRAFT_29622 [Blyttiomyces helicus]|uniref:Uncharacterized protein n=1 Tax=Blyttiomyces helicus TaxID=388810 RepID=A0A4P9WU31_9FUNG|nr:hypothetical protein BDK51DRAFT_29622 [Blyttiomyces helicus]|eukprot:RKO94626.1 hypothetical protein BDK51DRAFT_29622 [Blyttiomyces helicus]
MNRQLKALIVSLVVLIAWMIWPRGLDSEVLAKKVLQTCGLQVPDSSWCTSMYEEIGHLKAQGKWKNTMLYLEVDARMCKGIQSPECTASMKALDHASQEAWWIMIASPQRAGGSRWEDTGDEPKLYDMPENWSKIYDIIAKLKREDRWPYRRRYSWFERIACTSSERICFVPKERDAIPIASIRYVPKEKDIRQSGRGICAGTKFQHHVISLKQWKTHVLAAFQRSDQELF